ncbi:MAG: hypothetical protein OXR73_10945 [Myxococcales bacterium]|nr:hypothetical protein [Myxococcales bacterium]
MDIAGYPVGEYHSWHGRITVDLSVAKLGERGLYRMGLAMHTVADHRNDIYFRLTRLYYDATQLVEYRLGRGVVYAGLRHRCSHGIDDAVEGRILIRSGPELGHHHEVPLGPLRLAVRSFVHGNMIAQNPDTTFRPRLLLASTAQVRFRTGSLELLASAGLGGALVSGTEAASAGETFGFGSPWRNLKLVPLPAAALGMHAHGRVAAFTTVVHLQRLLDNGFGDRADSETLMAVELGFLW